MNHIEAMKQALPCCGYDNPEAVKWNPHNQIVQCHNCGQVYTPQRQPLSDEQIDELSRTMVKGNKSVNWLARAIEAAHGITYQGEQTD